MTDNAKLYHALYRIRRFEETVLEQFPSGVFHGTTHTYLGQEANAVGVLSHLGANDVVVSNHRCHGHFLAYGGDMRALFAELMGRATGICGGRGGSQHLHWRNFYSNGVLGGTVPIATGIALAAKYQAADAICIAFLGDGTFGEGVVYESLNIAQLWGAPVLYVVENNHIAQSTPSDMHLAGDIASRFAAFKIPVKEMDTSNVIEIYEISSEWINQVRDGQSPRALILHTSRFGPHSKGDDSRDPQEIALLRKTRDPLQIHGARLDSKTKASIHTQVELEVDTSYEQALNDPFPPVDG